MRLAVLGLIGCASVWAHDPITTKLTWSREISRILVARCGQCHHGRGPAPMALLDYEQARPWAKAIKEEVIERRMPPGGVVSGFGDLAQDGALSQEEIHLIADWVEGGAPEGDPRLLPNIPVWWPEPKGEPAGREVRVQNGELLNRELIVTAVRIDKAAEGSAVKVMAEHQGRVEPLVWVQGFREKWKRAYAFRRVLKLPAGSQIHVVGPSDAVVVLIEPKR